MNRQALREARIDLGAISRNVEILRDAVGPAELMAVVKANGYGHGALPVAHAALAGGASWLGVVDTAEARELRAGGITVPILSWLHAPDDDFSGAADAAIDVGVSSMNELERAARARVANVQLKIDTGLSRNGVPEAQWQRVCERAKELQDGPLVVRGIFSHLANAAAEDTAVQLARFATALSIAESAGLNPEIVHIASTAGALRVPESRNNLVRIGIGIYGLSPFEDASSAQLGLTPALELSADVISVKRVQAGEGVSYGFQFRANADTTLALIPLGYADGIPRQASNLGPVMINGDRFQVAGTIAMDQFIVDVGDTPVSVGDRAIVFGDPRSGAPSATDWADAAGTINYEIVTRLGPRVQRHYVGET